MIAYATRIQIRLNKDFCKVSKFFISLCSVPHVCQKAFSYLYRTFLLEVFTKSHQKLNSRWYTCTHSLGVIASYIYEIKLLFIVSSITPTPILHQISKCIEHFFLPLHVIHLIIIRGKCWEKILYFFRVLFICYG